MRDKRVDRLNGAKDTQAGMQGAVLPDSVMETLTSTIYQLGKELSCTIW